MTTISQFERRLKYKEEQKAKAQKLRQRKAKSQAAAKKKLKDKLAAKQKRALLREKDRRRREAYFKLVADEIINRRLQGQSAKQIAPIVGVSATRIRQHFKECRLVDTD